MKKFCKKVLSLILIASFVLSVAPVNIFAGGGGSSSSSVDTTVKKDTMITFTSGDGKFPGAPAVVSFGDGQDGSTNAYLLSVTLGRLDNVNISSIIVSYYTDNDAVYPYKQVLEVNRQDYDSSYNSAVNSVTFFSRNTLTYPYYGSRFSTYRYLVGSETQLGASQFYGFEDAFYQYQNYESSAEAVVSGIDVDTFPSPLNKVGTKEDPMPMQHNNTEYIEFIPEYNFHKLESVSFVCEKVGDEVLSGEIEIMEWALYKVKNQKTVNAINFAFVSDSLGLVFDGDLVYRSTEKSNEKVIEGITVAPVNVITYYTKDLLPQEGFSAEYEDYTSVAGIAITDKEYQSKYFTNHIYPDNPDKYSSDSAYLSAVPKGQFWEDSDIVKSGDKWLLDLDTYKSDIMGGNMQLLCCEKASGSIDKYADVLTFVITLADEYGAGIEQFNTAPGQSTTGYANPLKLYDVLTATIVYKDSVGNKQQVSLPVISNAILTALVDSDEGNIESISSFKNEELVQALNSGEYVQFAQQGERLTFGVTFPSVDSIESVKISYNNPNEDSDDSIAIESIAVFDNNPGAYTTYAYASASQSGDTITINSGEVGTPSNSGGESGSVASSTETVVSSSGANYR
ncbi:MAG: hypothetical protein Q4E99_04320, partial [Bacillota bacterium]|nr:hypothetical protein [Bacillota bacterium]